MTNKLIELQSKIELVQEVIDIEYSKLKQSIETVLMKYLESYEGVVLKVNLGKDGDHIRAFGDVSFYNDTTKDIDFGSSFDFSFTPSQDGLRVNHGTCGYWGKQDVYQIRRVQVLANLFAHVEELEASLMDICKSDTAAVYNNHQKEYYNYAMELESIKSDQVEEEKKRLVDALRVNDVLVYDDSVGVKFRRFRSDIDTWCISKICDKTIKLTSKLHRSKLIEKTVLADLLYRKSIIVMRENE